MQPSDNSAAQEGFTRAVHASAGAIDLFLFVRPDADLDDRFKAWDTDAQCFIYVNGWLFTFEDDGALVSWER